MWILLDHCSIDSVANNLDYVEDVKNFSKHEELTVLMNGDSLIFDRKECLTFLPLNVHANENYLSKFLSLKHVKNIVRVHVTMATPIEKSMNVILRDGTVFKFKEFLPVNIIMIWRALMYSILIKLMQQLPPTPCCQL